MSTIRLSPKYGFNPTIPICFWCEKEKNEIALMGKIGNGRKGEDIEAPRNMFLDYEPCDECKKKWSLGITLIETTNEPNFDRQPSFGNGAYPTGRYCVIKEEAFKRIFNCEFPLKKIAMVDKKIMDFFTKGEEK